MQIQTYLNRINYTQSIRADVPTLRGLQRAHMLAVPFENLDIVPLQRPIRLNQQALWDKIVLRKRGGFCYELNGMFAWLLKQIGFDVTYLNGRVFNREAKLGMDFDHLALLVKIPNQSIRWLADVGFGDSFTEPLNFEDTGEQVQGLRSYKLEQTPEGFTMWQRGYEGTWKRQYFFDLQPRTFPADYEAGCLYHQTSSKSTFTQKSIISRATDDGRISLEKEKLIVTKNGQRKEQAIAEEEYPLALKEYFGVIL